jgi:hypothetical protein
MVRMTQIAINLRPRVSVASGQLTLPATSRPLADGQRLDLHPSGVTSCTLSKGGLMSHGRRSRRLPEGDVD